MKNLSNLIKGLQIIKDSEGESKFNSQDGYLYIGEATNYSEEKQKELENIGFSVNFEYDCFEFNLD